MRPRLRLEIRPLSIRKDSEKGIVLVLVSIIVLIISWVVAHLYLQSSLALKMAQNSARQFKEQIKVDNEVLSTFRSLQNNLNNDFKQDPHTYFSKYQQSYPNDFLGCIASDGSMSDCKVDGFAIAKREVGIYQITYSIPIVFLIPTSINIQILSWSKMKL